MVFKSCWPSFWSWIKVHCVAALSQTHPVSYRCDRPCLVLSQTPKVRTGDLSCLFLCRAKTQKTTIPSRALTRSSPVGSSETGCCFWEWKLWINDLASCGVLSRFHQMCCVIGAHSLRSLFVFDGPSPISMAADCCRWISTTLT